MTAGPRGHRVSLLVPSVADCVMLIVLAVTAIAWARPALNTDGDAGRHIRVGETILQDGLFYEDLFSHTRSGAEFIPYEWASEVLTALAHRAGGLPAVVILTSLVVAASWGLMALFLRRSGVDPLLAFLTSMAAAAASAFHWLARPHVYTFLGSITLLWLLERGSRRGAVWITALFAVWANLHGGFLFGLVLICLYLAGDALELWGGADRDVARARLGTHALYLGAAIVGAAVNPSGVALFAHVTGYLGEKYLVDHTNEYMSPDFHLWFGRAFLVVLLAVLASLAFSRRRPPYTTLVVLLATVAFALHSARNIPLFCLTALPLLAVHLDPEWRELRWRSLARLRAAVTLGDRQARAGGWAAAATLLFVGLGLSGGRVAGVPVVQAEYDATIFPVDAIRYARGAGLEGRMFNAFIWGGYILYAWPEQRVFIDGQTDFYGEALTREYARIAGTLPGWREGLDERSIELVIVPSGSPLSAALADEPGWRTAHRDSTAVVYQRM